MAGLVSELQPDSGCGALSMNSQAPRPSDARDAWRLPLRVAQAVEFRALIRGQPVLAPPLVAVGLRHRGAHTPGAESIRAFLDSEASLPQLLS